MMGHDPPSLTKTYPDFFSPISSCHGIQVPTTLTNRRVTDAMPCMQMISVCEADGSQLSSSTTVDVDSFYPRIPAVADADLHH